MDDLARRHAVWVARAMSRPDLAPLGAADILALEDAVQPRRVEAGTVLITADSVPDAAYIVREGRLLIASRTPATGRQTIDIAEPGAVVGDLTLFTGRPSDFDVIADVDSTVLEICRQRLMRLLTSSPSLALRWTASVAERLEVSQRRVVTLATKDLASQIATILLDHRVEDQGAWIVRMSHQTIAHLLGARRQSVSRVLGQLRRDGLVRSRYGAVELLDVEGVADLAGEDAAEGLRESA